ncbi:MAG: FixH family protein [Saprospiraceae bacterium]
MFNWGTGIALTYIAFVVFMIGAVMVSRRHDPGLVEKNYYELDLHYQAHLEKKQNAAALAVAPKAKYDFAAQRLILQFPPDQAPAAGVAKLYRGATGAHDRLIRLESAAADGSVVLTAKDLLAGRWRMDLDWQDAKGTPYFYEGDFTVAAH